MAREYKPRKRSGFYVPHDLYVDRLMHIPAEKRLKFIDALAMYSKAEADGTEWKPPVFEYPDNIVWDILKDSVDAGINRYEALRHKSDNGSTEGTDNGNKPPGGEPVITSCNQLEPVATYYNNMNRSELNRTEISRSEVPYQGRPGLRPDIQEVAAFFHESGLMYDNRGKGGTLEGAIGSALNDYTVEEMKKAIVLMAEEVKNRWSKKRQKIRSPWGYYLETLASVAAEENQRRIKSCSHTEN